MNVEYPRRVPIMRTYWRAGLGLPTSESLPAGVTCHSEQKSGYPEIKG